MGKIIKRIIDNSYVIEKNGMPYHVPNEGEYAEEWAEVNAYAEAYPEEVELEYPYEPTFEELVAAKRSGIAYTANTILNDVKAKYTIAEIESWSKQEQGAKDIVAGNTNTDCAKFVANIASQRDIETETLVNKILSNAEYYNELSSKVIGEQQRLEDLVNLAEASGNKEELEAIVWEYEPITKTAL